VGESGNQGPPWVGNDRELEKAIDKAWGRAKSHFPPAEYRDGKWFKVDLEVRCVNPVHEYRVTLTPTPTNP
jgi:hypothetical protein